MFVFDFIRPCFKNIPQSNGRRSKMCNTVLPSFVNKSGSEIPSHKDDHEEGHKMWPGIRTGIKRL